MTNLLTIDLEKALISLRSAGQSILDKKIHLSCTLKVFLHIFRT